MNEPKSDMPEKSSAGTWPLRTRLVMVALNFLPLLHAAGVGACILALDGGWRIGAAVLVLFLLPPLIARMLLLVFPIPAGSHPVGSRAFLIWWASAQCQMLFCRFPFLEECLRLVPGLYSCWLRLWGAKIGRLTFWPPGLRILDRSLLRIGHDVVFGSGVRLNAHVIARDENTGELLLHLAEIEIGDGAHIGGYSLLTAGSIVERGEHLKAFSLSPPFTRWRDNRRTRPAIPT
jgi:hypothetical protein